MRGFELVTLAALPLVCAGCHRPPDRSAAGTAASATQAPAVVLRDTSAQTADSLASRVLPDSLDREGIEHLIGANYDDVELLVPGARQIAAWVVGDVPSNYGVTYASTAKRGFVLLDGPPRDADAGRWRVLDAIWLPGAPDSSGLATPCGYGDGAEESLFGIATNDHTQRLEHITHAWRANTAAARFERVSIAGLWCQGGEE